jgi:hypothetical protein
LAGTGTLRARANRSRVPAKDALPMKRLLSALLAGSAAVAAVLLLDSFWIFWVALAIMMGCAVEYVALGGRVFRDLPPAPLLVAMPVVATSWLYPDDAS